MAFWKKEKKELPSGKVIFTNKGLAQWNTRNFDTLAKEGYEQNAVVFACVNKIKKCVSAIEFKAFRDTKEGREELKDHPILKLIYNPNLLQSKQEFLGDLVSYFVLGGNAFIQKNNSNIPTELFNINPKFVNVVEGNTGYPEGYEIQAGGGNIRYPLDTSTGKCEILHIKEFNPRNNWFGLSSLEATAQAVDIFNSGQLWNYTILQNGGEPSGILKSKTNLTEDQFSRMKEMADAMSGASKAGKKIILEADVEYIQTGMNSKDMDFKEAQLMNARYIAMALGVPPQIINLAGNDSTFSNYEQATLSFYQDTIIPMTQTIINALNRWLGVYYKKDGVYLDIDYASISALDYTRREKDKAAIELKGAGIISTNEARLRIGEEIYNNAGDKILVSGANVPLEVAEEADFTNEVEQDFTGEQSGKEKV